MAQEHISDPAYWRMRAEQTRILARTTRYPEARRLMLKLAEEYVKLIERTEERRNATT